MRVLLVKTSSLGDIIHTLPAITDLKRAMPHCDIDWVVEEAFQAIPTWHPAINQVIPVAIRRWRNNLLKTWRTKEWNQFKQTIQQKQYDYVIDAQGLLKSAFLTRLAHGKTYGFDKHSIREPMASLFYQHRMNVSKNQHAIERIRQLFAAIFNYQFQADIDYGLDATKIPTNIASYHQQNKSIIFLHGTTWETKLWPEFFWIDLAKKASLANFTILLPWGDENELARAHRIKAACDRNVVILPKLNLTDIAGHIASAHAAVAVDTGLLHLAAAFNIPTVSLYGPTNDKLTGSLGQHQIHLSANLSCAPCLKKICHYQGPVMYYENDMMIQPPCFAKNSPNQVWESLTGLLARKENMVIVK